jgi:outer membrane protein assembly factor BamB
MDSSAERPDTSQETLNSTDTSAMAIPQSSMPALSLRWWPAAVLLVLMALIRSIPVILEAPPFPVVMAGFMGPAVVGAGILLWWLFASRATLKERIVGVVVIGLIGVASALCLHASMQGMSTILYQIPVGTASFALALIVLAGRPALRLPVALMFSALGFGVWDLFQLQGVNGKFAAEFLWRWSPTPEQEYLKGLAQRAPTGEQKSANVLSADSSGDVINRTNSQWTDFRGPLRDGRLPGVILDADWKIHPPKLVWKHRIGPGWSSFSVSGNRIFTQEQRGDDEAIVCMNASDGNELWSYQYPGRFWESVAGAGPRATPTIGDDGLYCLGANGNLLCLNALTGAVIWQTDLQVDSGRKPPQWGFASSPLIHEGLVIVHAGGSGDRGVFAYDAKSGEKRWSAASGDHSYSSPHLATFDGVTGILMQTNDGLQFLGVQDGAVLWNYDWKLENYRAIQPLVSGNSVLVATSLGLGTRRITVTHESGKWATQEDWTSKEMKPDFNDFVEHGGYVYGFDGNIFGCIDLSTGKRMWKRGRYGNGQVLLLSDAGQLLVISETGELILVQADPKQLVEVAKIQAIEGKTWNHPVLIGNRLYLRNGEEAACYELAVAGVVKSETAAATNDTRR